MIAAARPASNGLPEWLRPVADAASTITAAQLSRYVPPPPDTARPAAVLMLFGESDSGPDLLLIERAHALRSHAGQLAFPGGATDPDDDGPEATALRESTEEVGVDPTGVELFGRLPRLWLPPSNFAVTVVLGWWREPSPVSVVDPGEVASVFRVPLAELVDPANRFTVRHPSGWLGPAFAIDTDAVDGELVLWGFTAGVVSRLFAYVGWERPWDESRVRPLPDVGGLTG
jgi:8-oxo-dGTP pyrophosphatase MutT (NUDIX family)